MTTGVQTLFEQEVMVTSVVPTDVVVMVLVTISLPGEVVVLMVLGVLLTGVVVREVTVELAEVSGVVLNEVLLMVTGTVGVIELSSDIGQVVVNTVVNEVVVTVTTGTHLFSSQEVMVAVVVAK